MNRTQARGWKLEELFIPAYKVGRYKELMMDWWLIIFLVFMTLWLFDE